MSITANIDTLAMVCACFGFGETQPMKRPKDEATRVTRYTTSRCWMNALNVPLKPAIQYTMGKNKVGGKRSIGTAIVKEKCQS